MFEKKLLSSVALIIGLAFAGAVHAVSITPTVSFDAGTLLTTTGLSNFNTTGADMAGIEVTAYFDDNTTEMAVWTATGGSAGTAAGTGWNLGNSGSTTFNSPWIMTLSITNQLLKITRLVIDGQPGSTVFDMIPDAEITPGSANGQVISSVDGPTGLTVDAVYRNQVALNNVFYGDLYAVLDLSFGGTNGGLTSNDTLSFIADTDNTAIQGDINPVPEPASLALLGLGLAGLGFTRRRKRA